MSQNNQKVVARPVSFAEIVRRNDPNYKAPEPAYQFSNGAKFQDSGANRGIYTKWAW